MYLFHQGCTKCNFTVKTFMMLQNISWTFYSIKNPEIFCYGVALIRIMFKWASNQNILSYILKCIKIENSCLKYILFSKNCLIK